MVLDTFSLRFIHFLGCLIGKLRQEKKKRI